MNVTPPPAIPSYKDLVLVRSAVSDSIIASIDLENVDHMGNRGTVTDRLSEVGLAYLDMRELGKPLDKATFNEIAEHIVCIHSRVRKHDWCTAATCPARWHESTGKGHIADPYGSQFCLSQESETGPQLMESVVGFLGALAQWNNSDEQKPVGKQAPRHQKKVGNQKRVDNQKKVDKKGQSSVDSDLRVKLTALSLSSIDGPTGPVEMPTKPVSMPKVATGARKVSPTITVETGVANTSAIPSGQASKQDSESTGLTEPTVDDLSTVYATDENEATKPRDPRRVRIMFWDSQLEEKTFNETGRVHLFQAPGYKFWDLQDWSPIRTRSRRRQTKFSSFLSSLGIEGLQYHNAANDAFGEVFGFLRFLMMTEEEYKTWTSGMYLTTEIGIEKMPFYNPKILEDNQAMEEVNKERRKKIRERVIAAKEAKAARGQGGGGRARR